ncbi:RDD family protein [Streptomyces sp. NBC_01429]|uniref:RDD family protein n=1 Tax=Streptomyces sp. NBC_01429 TaxID=2903862 RepID=UPI002E294019|nr:RDD family protein [Streptomyces sp. NBC_01429]
MATPPGDGGNVPREGFYPDPSIPGYVRYWNGAAWVPGTSRPAPQDEEGPRAALPPAPARPGFEETGPVFLDEEPVGPARQEPASAWQADASRQSGFGGDGDARVSWGAPGQDPRIPRPAASAGPVDPRIDPAAGAPGPGDPTGGALPGMRALGADAAGGPQHGADGSAPAADGPVSDGTVAIRPARRGAGGDPGTGTGGDAGTPARPLVPPTSTQPPVDSTVAIRALRAARRAKAEGDAAAGRTGQTDGTMAIRALSQGATGASKAAKALPKVPPQSPPPQLPQAQPQLPSRSRPQPTPAPVPEVQAPSVPDTPISTGSGGGATSWAQQVHQLARADDADQPVVPWKPPVEDPFLQAARAQAASRPAGLGKRLVARLIDSLVLGVVVGALAVPLVSRALAHIDDKIDAARRTGETVTVWLLDGTTAAYLGAVLVALLVVGALYEALPTAKWGRTLGKKLCGLDVRDIESHEAPGFGAALRRWLVYGLLGLVVIGVVNVLWCLIDRPWRQCWHDKAARTFVAG